MSTQNMSAIAREISQIKEGDRVRMGEQRGTVADTNGATVRVNWDDGEWSFFHKRDGFTLFAPISPIEDCSPEERAQICAVNLSDDVRWIR